ncbi:MAG: hypothetical protein E6I20_05080 [Chloroflexi bacterium]|nr:MAG: hypothetical protein E6I20_05080 [Chloroflexota bacterium]
MRPADRNDAGGRRRDWYCEDVLSGRLKVDVLYDRQPRRRVPPPEPSLLVALVTAVQSVARRLGLDRAGFHVEAYAMDPEVTPHVHWHVFGPGREAARGEDARSKL